MQRTARGFLIAEVDPKVSGRTSVHRDPKLPFISSITPTSPRLCAATASKYPSEEIVPAIRRGIAKTREGTPALLEFITEKAVDLSRFA